MKHLLKRLIAALLGRDGPARFMLRALYKARFLTWCRAHPGRLVEGRWDVHRAALDEAGADQPINYLEFGVYRGDSIQWWIERNIHSESRFVGFDSFRGLPRDWIEHYPRGAFDTGGQLPAIADSRCSFEVGLFEQTLPRFLSRFRSACHPTLIHMDADLFSSTLFVLVHLAPGLRSGDILIFDEFHDYMHEFRAFYEANAVHPLSVETLAATSSYDGFGFGKVAMRVTKHGG